MPAKNTAIRYVLGFMGGFVLDRTVGRWLDGFIGDLMASPESFVAHLVVMVGVGLVMVGASAYLWPEATERESALARPTAEAGVQILFDPTVDVIHTLPDSLANRPGTTGRRIRVVTSHDTDRLAVRVIEMRTVQGAWRHTPLAARYLFAFPAYLKRFDEHAEAVAGSEKSFGLVEKPVTRGGVLRLLRSDNGVDDFSALANRAACITVEASAPTLGVARSNFHVWAGFTGALYCVEQELGHDAPPTAPTPRQPNANELRLLGYYFAEGTELRNYGFQFVTTEGLDEWIKKTEAWSTNVFNTVDDFSPALAARFRTLNERAIALPDYMTIKLVEGGQHELVLRCHQARLRMLEFEILKDVTPDV